MRLWTSYLIVDTMTRGTIGQLLFPFALKIDVELAKFYW